MRQGAQVVGRSSIELLSRETVQGHLERVIRAAAPTPVIATANTRDRGVNDMSAALKRRFNIVVLPSPANIDTEIDIVRKRVRELALSLDLNFNEMFPKAGERRRARRGEQPAPADG